MTTDHMTVYEQHTQAPQPTYHAPQLQASKEEISSLAIIITHANTQFCTNVVGVQGTSTCCKGSPSSSNSLSAALLGPAQ